MNRTFMLGVSKIGYGRFFCRSLEPEDLAAFGSSIIEHLPHSASGMVIDFHVNTADGLRQLMIDPPDSFCTRDLPGINPKPINRSDEEHLGLLLLNAVLLSAPTDFRQSYGYPRLRCKYVSIDATISSLRMSWKRSLNPRRRRAIEVASISLGRTVPQPA